MYMKPELSNSSSSRSDGDGVRGDEARWFEVKRHINSMKPINSHSAAAAAATLDRPQLAHRLLPPILTINPQDI